MNTPDIFALGGQQDDADAELFTAIAEYQRIENMFSGRGDDDIARLCSEQRPHRDFVEQYRPATIRGVLAALDFGSEIDDPHYWPEGATEGLRALTHRKGAAAPASEPIASAPKIDDAKLLLYLDDEARWCVGYWCENGWYGEAGIGIKPIAWAPLPPAPVSGGLQDDAELVQAGERWDELHRRLQDHSADGEAERLSAEQGRLVEVINNAEPASLLGCCIKLRVLADPNFGMEAGDRDDDVIAVRQVLAFLEHMTGGAS